MRLSQILILGLLGCSDIASPTTDLQVTATLTPSVIRAGERVAIEIKIVNVGRRTHVINPSSCPPNFEVTSLNGTIVGPPYAICTLPLTTKEIAPGEVFSRMFYWHGEGRGGSYWPSPNARLLPSGEYLVRPWVAAHAGKLEAPSVALRIE